MRTASAEVSVVLNPETALRAIARALLSLDENGEVTVDKDSRSAWLDTPWSWKSVSERVTVELLDGDVIRVTSQSRHPAWDYGKNQENVDSVIAAFERLHDRSDPSD